MKKNTIINLVLISCFAGGILFIKILNWQIFGGVVCGSSATLFYINQVGQRQLEKASKRVEKLLRDKVVAINSDAQNFNTDD